VNVCIVAEYYPRRRDPVLGVWAHKQAVAARDAGADVKVLVLERPVPPAAALRRPWRLPGALLGIARQPPADRLDDIDIRYVRFRAGSRERSYTGWHEKAAGPLGRALGRLHAKWPIDVIHAHYALPAGGAALPFAKEHRLPLVVSVHGGDVFGPLLQTDAAREAVAKVLRAATEVLCNSRATRERVAGLMGTDERVRIVHLGADPPPGQVRKRPVPTVSTLAHVIPRKRHGDVLDALAELPDVQWLVIGDGPELPELRRRATELGMSSRVQFAGQLPHNIAQEELATTHVMALPSEDEAFGVAYIEALAAGVPAIGCRGEGGPDEIASMGGGMLLVPPRDPAALAETIRQALAAPELAEHARRTAAEYFSWQRCGRDTVAGYRDAMSGS
jgi:glycosyltransferase involved in cell wall biosynthesis